MVHNRRRQFIKFIATVNSSRSIIAYYVRVFASNVKSPESNPPQLHYNLHLFDDKLNNAGQQFTIQPKTQFLCTD